MRILHLRSGQGIYGAETVILGLARASSERHEIVVCSLADERWDSEPKLLEAARAGGLETAAVPVKGRADPAAALRIRRLCKEKGVDVLHSHDYKSTILGALATAWSGVRHVATLHGDTGESTAVKVYERALYAMLPALDGVATVSSELEQRVKRTSPRAKVSWIANGLDEGALTRKLSRPPLAIRKELGVELGQKLVLAVGRLSVEKNHLGLIDAVAGLQGDPDDPADDVILAIAGDGPLHAELEARAGQRGLGDHVRLLGARSDVADLYRAADVLAHPSTTEGLPMVILEAMAVGTPIVASAVGEIPRVVDADGNDGEPCGYVVPPGDVAALRDTLEHVLNFSPEERIALAERSRARLRDRYGVDAMARRYERELYGAS